MLKVEVIKGPLFDKVVKQAQAMIAQKALDAYGLKELKVAGK